VSYIKTHILGDMEKNVVIIEERDRTWNSVVLCLEYSGATRAVTALSPCLVNERREAYSWANCSRSAFQFAEGGAVFVTL
jgi:hypothetical protein